MATNLKKRRGGLRAITTKLIKELQDRIASKDVNEVKILFQQLEIREKGIREVDRLLEDAATDDEVEAVMQEADTYSRKLIAVKIKVDEFLQSLSSPTTTTTTTLVNPTGGGGSSASQSVKLPRLEIEKFRGNILEWQNFWDQFKAAVHDDKRLTDIQKFTYLKTLVEGPARSAIIGLALTAANYGTAIKLVQDRFGQKELIVHSHFKKLMELKPIGEALTDVNALRKLYDEVEIQVLGLEALGVGIDTYGRLLCTTILQLLPASILIRWNRGTAAAAFDLAELRKFLRCEVESRERSAAMLWTGTQKDEHRQSLPLEERKSVKRSITTNRPSTAALVVSANPTEQKDHTGGHKGKDNKCVFCDATDHESRTCRKIDTVEKRRDFVKKKGRCFLCLGTSHIARRCFKKINCEDCGGKHHVAVCMGNLPKEEETNPKAEQSGNKSTTLLVTTENDAQLLLPTAEAWAEGRVGGIQVRCLLDGGSHRTFIRETVVSKLHLPTVGTKLLTVRAFGDSDEVTRHFRRIKVCLKSLHDSSSVDLIAFEIPKICSDQQLMPRGPLVEEMERLGMSVANCAINGEDLSAIDILIGQDSLWKISKASIKYLGRELVAEQSIFGWSIQGVLPKRQISGPTNVMTTCSQEPEPALSSLIRQFWELESLGIEDCREKQTRSEQDLLVHKDFQETIRYLDCRYEVRLPWKEDTSKLKSNYRLAHKRLLRLLHRFYKEPSLYPRYERAMRDYMELGHVEEVDAKKSITGNLFYLPHHAVIKEDRLTTKVRVVFDASAHEDGAMSLNDCLYPGPNLNPSILTLLLKFRMPAVAMTADIEKAFLQVSLAEEDRDATRMLWIRPNWNPKEEPEIFEMRMTRVLFGASSSPFLLAATVRHHAKKYADVFPQASRALDQQLYVDDLITGKDSDDDAYQLYKEVQAIMDEAGMPMKKWLTNSKGLQARWQEDLIQQGLEKTMTFQLDDVSQKVLGLVWDPRPDTLRFQLKSLLEFLNSRQDTKRSVLQGSARIFDPLGFISPIVIEAKCMFQEMWERKCSWDEPLPEDLACRWEKWCVGLPELQTIHIPRRYCEDHGDESGHQLHVFTDASKRAYGAVIYLRCQSSDETSVTLIASKSRVAPLKKITVPRLELLGTLIGVRLARQVQTALSLEPSVTHFWTDSMIALGWIQSSAKSWNPFVANRIEEIQDLSNSQQWRHCPGEDNPADLVSRGQSVGKLKQDSRWWHGPTWLSRGDSHWPQEINITINDGQEEEVEVLVTVTKNGKSMEPILDLTRFGKLKKVLRVGLTAWALRFVERTRKKGMHLMGLLSVRELETALEFWIIRIQAEGFGEDIDCLREQRELTKESQVRDLHPVLDSVGVLRVGGRLHESSINERTKHPIILPRSSKFTELLVEDVHVRLRHAGVQDILTDLREHYWIVRARQLVKKIIHRCVVCRRLRAQAGSMIEGVPPKDRIERSPPFSVIGIDFAGPLLAKDKAKSQVKTYILLITCAVTRAVHLELVSKMDTEHFLLAFRRFVGRRGICRVIYSDNAKTFKRASSDLQRLWNLLDKEQIHNYFGGKGIVWKFIVERGAWWGGFWERLVQSVKACLKRTLGNACLSFEELCTVLIEIEAIINSRPLTRVYDDPDGEEPLTPSHFLIGGRLALLPYGKNIHLKPVDLRKRWKYRQELEEKFWRRWRQEYLLQLRSLSTRKGIGLDFVPQVGSLVIVKDSNVSKHLWKCGRVEEVMEGRDGKVRSCVVRMGPGKNLRRPIQLIYPLEM